MKKNHFLTWTVIVIAAIASISGSASAQGSCVGTRSDPIDFMYNTGTWHDWTTGYDYWDDPMGYCRGDGTAGGWGYTGYEWDWLYFGDWYNDHSPSDYDLADIPTPTISCASGYRPVEYVRVADGWVADQWCEKMPEPPHTLVSTEIDAWWDVAGMFFGWALGLGPDTVVYTRGSIQSYQMQQATGIQGARDSWYQQNWYHIAHENCQNLEPLTVSVRFGLQGLRDGGGNATQQFVGSYNVYIDPHSDGSGRATFSVWNVTSMTSLLYDLGPSWSRESFPPGGNETQIYTWEEQMCGPN
jgi:hypothetical protein